jgi:site-specific recombinase XerD
MRRMGTCVARLIAVVQARTPFEERKALSRELWSVQFNTQRGAPFSTAGFARMVERAGIAADLGLKAHPHMLRHACGFARANKGHDTRSLASS